MTPRRCDAPPSVDPVETMAEAARAGYGSTQSGGWIHPAPLHLSGSEVMCWFLEGVSPPAEPSDVGRVVGLGCNSGGVAGQCGRMLGSCERALSLDAGSVVWWPVLEVQ